MRGRACRETAGPGPGGVKRHRLGIGVVDGRSLWTGAWLCGRAEESQRPVTAHGCSGCPLWQPCAATGRWHYSIVRTMTPSNHAPRVSFVCSKRGCLQLFAFCLHCCNSDGRFATLFEICGYDCCDSSIKFVWQGSVYIWCCGEGVEGGRGILDPGCSGRQIRGRLRSTLGRCGWRLPTLDVAGVVLWVPQPKLSLEVC